MTSARATIRRLGLGLGFATAALLSACSSGGDSSETTPASAPLGDAVTHSVGSAGGEVEATTLGVKMRLNIPRDALAADTTIKLTPVAPRAGDIASVRLEPAGVFFAKPVSVVLEYPAGQVPASNASLRQSLGGGEVFVTTTVDKTARTLSATLLTFGGATLQPLGTSAPRRHALADAPPDESGTLSAQQVTLISDAVALARERIAALEERGHFEDALGVQLSVANLVQRSGEDGYSAQAGPFLADAVVTACRGLDAAVAASRTAPIRAPGDFKPIVAKLMYWDSVVQRVGGTGGCSSPGAQAAANDVIARELVLARNNYVLATGTPQVAAQSADMRDARSLQAEARNLQATDPLSATMQLAPYGNSLRDGLLDPALVPARDAAWRITRSSGSLAHYVPLVDGFGTNSLLQQDAQYVRTSITINSKNSAGKTLSSATMGVALASEAPATPVRTASISARDATIEIGGSVGILAVDAGETEKLKVTFDGVEVASIASSGDTLMGPGQTPPTLTASSLLAAAGLPADDSGTHTLRILRTDAANALRLGIADDVLVAVTLNFAPPASGASFVGTWTAVNTCPNVGNDNEDVRVTVERDGPGSETAIMSVTFLRISPNHRDSRFPVVIAGDLAAEAQAIDPPRPTDPRFVPWVRLNIHAGSADYVSEVFAIDTCDDRAPGGGGSGVSYITMSLVRE